jgi:hypothetical protein
MMTKTESKEIMGHKYISTLFPAMQGYLLARKLLDIFVNKEPIAKLCEVDKNGDLILELLANTVRDDQVINSGSFNNIYTGNYKEMMGALTFVFEVNFKDFLAVSDTGTSLNPLEEMMAAVSQKG